MERFPTHLSVFALDLHTGTPLIRLPIYAEVGMRGMIENLPDGPVNNFTDQMTELLLGAMGYADESCFAQEACKQRTVNAIKRGISTLLMEAEQLRLGEDVDYTRSFFNQVIQRARDANDSASLATLNDEQLRRSIFDAIRAEARAQGLELVPGADPVLIQWAHPMGILATDHAGYLSFDMRRLPETVRDGIAKSMQVRQQDPQPVLDTTVWLYPLTPNMDKFDALAQARFAPDAIVVRLVLQKPNLPPEIENAGILSMQSPDLTDWRISPISFATNPGSLVGADGCETLLPANVALQEFHFYQVVRLTDVVPSNVPPDLQQDVKLGLVHDYRMTWQPLGHSLGQIQYSLPLAPGESVNLAIIDWTRRDETTRAEDTKLNEQLVHNQRRDRTITETVKAALSEYQEGSSFMAGLAYSGGISAGLSKSVGLAAGLAGALGGSSSDSSGSRDLAANTVQQLSENISQASAAMRELQSTVVVRSAQSENEAIETRTVVNYNHSHTLTILYYEVLRHFRILTELSTRRPAVLLKMKADWFNPTNIELTVLQNRAALEAALVDKKFGEAFNAVERVSHRRQLALAADSAPVPTPDPRSKEFTFFTFQMKTGGLFSQGSNFVNINATLVGSSTVRLVGVDPGPADVNLNTPGSFRHPNLVNFFAAKPETGTSAKWDVIHAIHLGIHPEGNESTVSFRSIKVLGHELSGETTELLNQNYEVEPGGELVITQGTVLLLPALRPPRVQPPSRPAEEIEDDAKMAELFQHLRHHSSHYSRAILLSQNAAARARLLDEIKLSGGTSLLDHVENRPLEVLGDYVAYPTADPKWSAEIRDTLQRTEQLDVPSDERLATLPTRGVFAEARLGHCNASEEIDNTRFWDWQQSPIPHMAPEIAPITAVTPQPQQQDVQPTPFPQSLVNIVNPPNAPDPTGLAAALNVLATPNIFRDMSGRAEVADLLKRLSDNSINIAQAANRAREIQAKYGGATGTAGGSGGGFGARATPTQPSAATRDLQDLRNELGQGVANNMTSPEKARSIYETAADNIASGAMLGFALSEDAGAAGPALDPGSFKVFVDANRLDIEIADVLRKLDIYPADTWAKQTATFAYHELEAGNLIALVKHTNVDKVKKLIPSQYHAEADDARTAVASEDFDAPFTDAITRYNIGGPHAYKGYILVQETQAMKATQPGRARMAFAVLLAHELTHLRNREFEMSFEQQVPVSNTVFVNMNAVMAHKQAALFAANDFMQELSCRHVEWRVQRDIMIYNFLAGVAPAAEDPKGFFRFALKIGRRLYGGNDYVKQLSPHQFNQQIGMWINFLAQTPNVWDSNQPNKEAMMLHDDYKKTEAIKLMFQNTYNAVAPAFDEPNVPMWGQGIDDSPV